MRIYAYVTTESVREGPAKLPGAEVNGKPVSKHGDYWAWTRGKLATLKIIADPKSLGWRYRTARRVAELWGWTR
jgi:hypothetical protein